MNRFLITDTNGNKSITATAFLIGFLVVNAKLLLSGMDFGTSAIFREFTGVDYAAALSALGGIYIMRRRGGDQKEAEDK